MKYYKISEKELRELLYSLHALNILERDGVDNWPWYMYGRTEYIAEAFGISEERASDKYIDDLVDWFMEGYEIIEEDET